MLGIGLLHLRGCGSSVCRENIGLHALYIFKGLKVVELTNSFRIKREKYIVILKRCLHRSEFSGCLKISPVL